MTLSGNPWDLLYAFLGGVLLSFTPCVYPLLPVTAGYIGITAGGSKRKGFILSFVYATGLAVVYSALGLIAVLTGKMFGRVSSHPATLIAVGAVFVFFGFSMFEFFALRIFPGIHLPGIKRKGIFPALLLGMFSGLVASPCVAPALGAILVYLAAKGNVFYGVSLLMAFAYGMGLIFILVGTFSTFLLHLPRSGRWMVYIERFCACVLIAAGCYFIFTGIRRI